MTNPIDNNIEKQKIDAEFAVFFSAVQDNLPKTQEMSALGSEKIFNAIKPAYLKTREYLLKFYRSKLLEEIEKNRIYSKQKPYSGNDLVEAGRVYGIAAENWSEIIRFENGYDAALSDVEAKIKETSI